MKDIIERYAIYLYKNVPNDVYLGLAAIFCIGVICLITFRGVRSSWRQIMLLLLIEYIVLIYSSTIILRNDVGFGKYNYTLFWSYEAIEGGKKELMSQNIMNVIVFVPIGFLLGCAFKGMKWWKTALIGLCFTISIEGMQLIFRRGFSETDDILHNFLGCMIGYGLYSLMAFSWRYVK